MKLFQMPILLLLLCCTCWVQGQEVGTGVEQQLENLSDVTETETEDDAYLQQLQQYLVHPLNINEATEADLQQLKMLTPLQISNVLAYKKMLGAFIDLHELQAVPALDVSTIKKLLPYITLKQRLTAASVLQRFNGGNHTVLARAATLLQKAKGYYPAATSHYLGGRERLLLRYTYRYQNLLQYGVLGDKDAGERFFNGAQKRGFDFYGFHLFARNLGRVKALAIGDFMVNMGQGLVQWQSLAFKKSSEVMGIIRQSATLMPYHSPGEFNYNRGIGVTLAAGRWESTLFAARQKKSANIGTDIINGESYFTSFATSGLHRTASEIADKKSIRQTMYGATLHYNTPFFKGGINAVQYLFSQPLQKRNEPYNIYSIKGRHWANVSADYRAVYKNLYFFGEAALAKNGASAFINGLLISADPKIDLSFLYRHISPRYQTLYGNAFTENTMPTNESGLYAGISIRPSAVWRINAYADFFKFPYLKYRTDAPSYGQDYLLMLTYHPQKNLELYARFRHENKGLNQTDDTAVTHTVKQQWRQNMRLHGSYTINRMWSVRSRVELMWYNKNKRGAEEGFLFYIEPVYTLGHRLTASMRIQYFETGGYNSRIYAYERDVPYSYSIPAFFDQGFRFYGNIGYGVLKKLTLALRFAQTVYTNKNTISSGLNLINGNKASEVKLQGYYAF